MPTIPSLRTKLSSLLLQRRLVTFLPSCSFRSLYQGAFRRGSHILDHAYILQTLIAQAQSKSQRLFVCFLDLRKAYNSVISSLLFHRLHTLGLPLRFIALLSRLYSSAHACVRTSSGLLDLFHPTCGVRQGDPLSPDLFNLFLDPLAAHLLATPSLDPPFLGPTPIPLLLFADDTCLISLSASGLEASLDAAHAFVSPLFLTVRLLLWSSMTLLPVASLPTFSPIQALPYPLLLPIVILVSYSIADPPSLLVYPLSPLVAPVVFAAFAFIARSSAC